MSAFFDELPHEFGIFRQQMLHVDLVTLVARERHVQFGQRAVAHVLVEFILVEIVLGLLATTIVQDGLAHLAALFLVEVSLLNEAAERRQTRARTDH